MQTYMCYRPFKRKFYFPSNNVKTKEVNNDDIKKYKVPLFFFMVKYYPISPTFKYFYHLKAVVF